MKLTVCWLSLALAAVPAAAADSTLDDEASLIAVIQSEATGLEARGVACRRLAVVGSRQAIAPLAALLGHPQLAHLARYGLEPMPYPEVDEVLRAALDDLSGRHLVGVINTIGVRRDSGAVTKLEPFLESNELEVADAAAAALGHIGTPAAARILDKVLKRASNDRRAFVADASLACAERLMESGDWNDARNLFDAVAEAHVPRHIRIAATRGAILSRRDGGVRMLINQIQGEDEAFMQLGMRVAREMTGVRATRALAALLPELSTRRQALLVTALGDRGDLTALDAIVKLAEDGAVEVRMAALRALVHLPAASVIPVMVAAGLDPDPRVSQTAQSALHDLPEGKTDRMLAARLPSSDPTARLLIIDVLARRRASDAQEELLALTAHEDPATRAAALNALGNVLTPAGWPRLVACLIQAATPEERQAADTALERACARFDDKPACAGPLITALAASDAETRLRLLTRLAQAGGPAALEAVRAYTVTGTPEGWRDRAIRAITEWSGPEALPDLQAMLEGNEPENPLIRTLAFRGFVRLVRDSEIDPDTKFDHLRRALELSRGPQDQRLALGALGSVASVDALNLAASALIDPVLATEAGAAVVQICEALNASQHPAAVRTALETVVDKVPDSATVRQARRLLRNLGQTVAP